MDGNEKKYKLAQSASIVKFNSQLVVAINSAPNVIFSMNAFRKGFYDVQCVESAFQEVLSWCTLAKALFE